MRSALIFVFLALAASPATSQSPLLRGFERGFFVERLLRVEKAYHAADATRREKANPMLASQRRWIGVGSGASRRLRLLANAHAVLRGLPADDPATLTRFDLMLYALPEVVDPQRTVGERRRYFAMRGFAPNAADTQPDAALEPNAERVYVTARAVYGLRKPDPFRLRMSIEGGDGDLAQQERGDSDDPSGWLKYDLSVSFDTTPWRPDSGPAWRSLWARLECQSGGEWPAAQAVRDRRPFHVAPGFWRTALECFELRRSCYEAVEPEALLHASIEVRIAEVVRVLSGDRAPLASWPCQALREAREMLELAREGKELPGAGLNGEEVLGLAGPRDVFRPMRVLWRREAGAQIPKATIVVAPEDFGVHWARSALGLGLDREGLLPGPGLVAFVSAGSVQAALGVLEGRFGVTPDRTQLLAVLEGATSARAELPKLSGKLGVLSFVASDVIGDPEILADKASRYRVIGAWGLPRKERLAVVAPMQERLGEAWPGGAYEVDVPGRRSLREALVVGLRW